MVHDTLDRYTGAGRPDLHITHASAGQDIGGGDNNGLFSTTDPTNYSVDYSGAYDRIKEGMSAEQIQDLGAWKLVGQVTLTLDTTLTINVLDSKTIRTALHELGHADQAVRTPLQYLRDAKKTHKPDGTLIDHDARPGEIVANKYRNKAVKEVGP